MRPAMMLLLRALVILGAVLAVVSCRNAFAAQLGAHGGEAFMGGADRPCSSTWTYTGDAPAAGGAFSNPGAGYCL
ncbi:MAG: hypothetical protein ABR537_05040 [Gemmatimonadales bacterium]